jgi:predicted DNA-binding transcriptional regulator AlpA
MQTQQIDDTTAVVDLNRHQRRTAGALDRRNVEFDVKDLLPVGLSAALNTEQAALYTGLAAATMEGLRSKGGGPRFVRYGRKAVRYLVSDLDRWISERTFTSTSEAA